MRGYKDSPVFVQNFIDNTVSKEGGYSDIEEDLGGKTKYGITEKVARDYGYEGNMEDLPLTVAKNIYAKEYYFKPKFNLVADESIHLAKEMFDTGVNCGVRVPVKFLQRILNVFNNEEEHYKDIEVDGYLGNNTMNAYKNLCNIRGGVETETVVYNCLNALQLNRYIELSEKREENETFTWGWIIHRTDYIKQPF